MRAIPTIVLATLILTATSHRLPAPISEEPTPTVAPKLKPRPVEHNVGGSPAVTSLERFNGMWRSTQSGQAANGISFQATKTIIIRNGNAATFTSDSTSTLVSGATWTDWPDPYNSMSPVSIRWVRRSSDLRAEGSNLRINWPVAEPTDWSPKSIPRSLLLTNRQSASVLYILNGDKLIATDGKESHTYSRVR
jgi:hypothetical protein